MQFTGQTDMQGGSEQCMHAMEMDRSPGLPSFSVTTRRRLMPQGTSCSFLHAVTHPLHSMQRSASQRNFIRAISVHSSGRLNAAQGHLGLLHLCYRVVSVRGRGIAGFAEYVG